MSAITHLEPLRRHYAGLGTFQYRVSGTDWYEVIPVKAREPNRLSDEDLVMVFYSKWETCVKELNYGLERFRLSDEPMVKYITAQYLISKDYKERFGEEHECNKKKS